MSTQQLFKSSSLLKTDDSVKQMLNKIKYFKQSSNNYKIIFDLYEEQKKKITNLLNWIIINK